MSQIGVWFPHRLDSRPYDAVEKFFQNKHPIVSFKIMRQYLDRPFKSIFVHGHFIQEIEKKFYETIFNAKLLRVLIVSGLLTQKNRMMLQSST